MPWLIKAASLADRALLGLPAEAPQDTGMFKGFIFIYIYIFPEMQPCAPIHKEQSHGLDHMGQDSVLTERFQWVSSLNILWLRDAQFGTRLDVAQFAVHRRKCQDIRQVSEANSVSRKPH